MNVLQIVKQILLRPNPLSFIIHLHPVHSNVYEFQATMQTLQEQLDKQQSWRYAKNVVALYTFNKYGRLLNMIAERSNVIAAIVLIH